MAGKNITLVFRKVARAFCAGLTGETPVPLEAIDLDSLWLLG